MSSRCRKLVLLLSLAASAFLRPCESIRVLKSLLLLKNDGQGLSGARLLSERQVDISDVTFCIRFKYKMLGGWEGSSQLMHIEDWREEPKVRTGGRLLSQPFF